MQASTCSICLEPYESSGKRTPRTLKECGHTFCETCIVGFIKAGVIVCANCRTITSLPASGSSGLHKAFALLDYLEEVKAKKLLLAESKSPLCSCGEANVALTCVQCGLSLCNECDTGAHARGERKVHARKPWSNVAISLKCEQHPNYPLDLVCQDESCSKTNTLICILCRDYGDHVKHKTVLLQQAVRTTRESLESDLKFVQTKGDKVASVATQVLDLLGEIGGTSQTKPPPPPLAAAITSPILVQDAIRAVRTEFKSLFLLLVEREKAVMDSILELKKSKLQKLEAQSVLLHGFLSEFFAATDEARNAICEQNDQQFMQLAEKAFLSLAALKTMPCLQPAASSTFKVNITSNLSAAIQNYVTISDVEVENKGFGFGKDGNLVVTGNVTLEANRQHEYHDVTVKRGGSLMINGPGALLIRATGLVFIEQGGTIDVNGKGYPGGVGAPGQNGNRGASTSGVGGGGGGAHFPPYAGSGGGGGGYGSAGAQGQSVNAGVGGQGGGCYGDIKLSQLLLGSGGGSAAVVAGSDGHRSSGGAGGGAIFIRASTVLNCGHISANGKPSTYNGGGGSGGSIWIQAMSLTSEGLISATGGAFQAVSGGGGDGRIRLDYDEGKLIEGKVCPNAGFHLGLKETTALDEGNSMLALLARRTWNAVM